MVDHFLKETAMDGYFTGLGVDKALRKKGAGKTKL
jgi:hypothetical protein